MTTTLTLMLPLQLISRWLPQAQAAGRGLAEVLGFAVAEAASREPLSLVRHMHLALGPSEPGPLVPIQVPLGPWAWCCLQRQAAAWDLPLETLAWIHLAQGPQGPPQRAQMA